MARIKQPDKIKLIDLMKGLDEYSGLPEGFVQLPIPRKVRIKRKKYDVPDTLDDFLKNLVYGQRIFFAKEEEDDFGVILRVLDGYYYLIILHYLQCFSDRPFRFINRLNIEIPF